MNVDTSVLNNINGGGANGLSARQSDELRESFMTLLITQLQNQDPLNPMENAEMTSQLAQINTVSGIEELNSTLEGITSQMDANQALQASGLIGKGVMVPGKDVLVEQDSEGNTYTTPFGIELAQPAKSVKATIVGQGGQVIRQLDLKSLDSGVHSFDWGGENDQGDAVASGRYSVQIEAVDAEGEQIESTALQYAVVNRVTPNDGSGSVRLDLGAIYGQVNLNDVKQIL
ncbi:MULTISPECIES: flagellar hook assembly protein FlgD [Halomonadaceae]|jgi:flagellar basal-body rod modification protein FlgD|uniref:Basal-body rod modification protein FlgD n=1 Tax=Vreelandella titanicae TaxID=664683 RepID=A0AAP9NQ92_9GAMM|nr:MULTISPECIES: flagellar hook assembly protein FlgD [Halomonas]QKS26342.1 Basal-body rod modification protein FlgD [Halomonas titanicae]CDG52476.1 Basal-body rod modification protein FlgD [Halomonas sp. A3H3]SDI77507.1 flagellar basal-body rod modification protein FlgD [Halomonas titanicae]|tara:strand:+ start:171 stop:860 length:690 start_codon:yes stop_codon:yes gene_type:complete